MKRTLLAAALAAALMSGALAAPGAAAPRRTIADTGFSDFQWDAWWTPYAMAGAYYGSGGCSSRSSGTTGRCRGASADRCSWAPPWPSWTA